MRSIVVLTVAASLGAWAVVRQIPDGEAAAPAPVAKSQEIESIALDGSSLPVAELRDALASRVGEHVDDRKLDRDRAALEAVLVARGFLAAHVAPAHVSFDAAGRAFVTFAVTRGAEFHVRSVHVSGAAPRDAGVVTLAVGEVVRADRIDRARDALSARLAARGKQGAVKVELAPDLASGVVDVSLDAR